MKIYSIDEVADTLIDLARSKGIDISNLKLQKLVYYAQAWSLVIRNGPLFEDEIEAWVHGPVVPKLFRRFREYGWAVIDGPVAPLSDAELRAFLKKILGAYGELRATQLEDLTHAETPWKQARGNTPSDAPSHKVISRQSMESFYSRKRHA